MPVYVYDGKTARGAKVSGERTADSKTALQTLLQRERIIPTKIKEKGKEFALPKFGGGASVKAKELAIFFRQFSVMIDSGLPLVQCLEILAGNLENPGFKKILTERPSQSFRRADGQYD